MHICIYICMCTYISMCIIFNFKIKNKPSLSQIPVKEKTMGSIFRRRVLTRFQKQLLKQNTRLLGIKQTKICHIFEENLMKLY